MYIYIFHSCEFKVIPRILILFFLKILFLYHMCTRCCKAMVTLPSTKIRRFYDINYHKLRRYFTLETIPLYVNHSETIRLPDLSLVICTTARQTNDLWVKTCYVSNVSVIFYKNCFCCQAFAMSFKA